MRCSDVPGRNQYNLLRREFWRGQFWKLQTFLLLVWYCTIDMPAVKHNIMHAVNIFMLIDFEMFNRAWLLVLVLVLVWVGCGHLVT